ncbi:MAG: A24 family peptidase [Gammaproteobacteria bacterium]
MLIEPSPLVLLPVLHGQLALMLSFAAYLDLRYHRIPNGVTFGGAVAGLVLQSYFSGFEALGSGFLGLASGLALFVPFYIRGAMGAGDVKLMAAVGAFLGPSATLVAAALTLIVGGVMAVAILLRHRGFGQLARRYLATLNFLVVTGTLNHAGPRGGEAAARRFPYALAIGLGTLWAILWLHK